MSGLIPQERLPDVEMHLQNNLLYIRVDSINHHLIKMILGPFFQHCRSIYLLSRSEALIDMVPKSDDLIFEEVLSLSGTQEYRNRTFQVTICLAQDKIPPNLMSDYALALVSLMFLILCPTNIYLANRDWIEFRVRRNSTTSQSTYPVVDTDEKAENASDITSLDPNAEEVKDSDTDTTSNPESESGEEPEHIEEVVTPESTGSKSPVREPTDTVSSLDETKDDTVVRNKQTQTPKHIQTPKKSDYISTVATPASPWQLPTTPNHTGHRPPPLPTPLKQELGDPPKHPPTPRDPFILDPIKKINPIQDPSFKFTQTDLEPKTKLKGKPPPPKRKSSELLTIRNPEYTPSKKYFPLSIPQFGEEDPGQFTFAPARHPQPKQPELKKPETLESLTQAM